MKHETPFLNVNDAKKEYIKSDSCDCFHDPRRGFSYYSPSYVLTNEDIRWIAGLTKQNAHRVLTTAGSGDQPMFYAMNGAEIVDTFDISFCAKAAMDIKSSAIHQLSREEYIKLLSQMHGAKRISDIENISKITSQTPKNTTYFVKEMDEYPIFSAGLTPENYAEFLPTEEEFAQMKKTVSAPFKFIWTDINSLHSHLLQEYDVINLSNILEYMTPEQISKTLVSLRNYVRPKGYIIAQTGSWGIHRNRKAFYEASQKFKRWAKIGLLQQNKKKVNSEMIVVLQRIR